MCVSQRENAQRTRSLSRLASQSAVALHQIRETNWVVGLERFELSTSRLSSARSNQLSYRPITTSTCPFDMFNQKNLTSVAALEHIQVNDVIHIAGSHSTRIAPTKPDGFDDDPHQTWRPSISAHHASTDPSGSVGQMRLLVREERETKAALSRVVVTSHEPVVRTGLHSVGVLKRSE